MAFTLKHLKSLVNVALKHEASDIHIRTGEPPSLRIRGDLVPVQSKTLEKEDLHEILRIIQGDPNLKEIDQNEIDGSFEVENVCRLRYNIFQYDRKIGIILRVIRTQIPTIEELGFDSIIKKIALKHRGLVLVTGATGSGKSSTLAAIINYINRKRAAHIISIEDPIEFVHQSNLSRITQREIGADTKNFTTALKSALRQDPDVILIGEMRDIETIAIALKAAETGHLVLSTMHTTDAVSTVGRIIGMFPAEEQPDLRQRLAESLYATIGQRMLQGRQSDMVVAQEIMISTPGIKECIVGDEDIKNINSIIERGAGKAGNGSCTFDQAIMKLYQNNRITKDTALSAATSSSDFLQKLIVSGS